MKIQTISIVVPTKGCVNKCKFCVSRMHDCPYEDKFDSFQIKKRIKWAISNNINTCIITGTGEALQNIKFLIKLLDIFIEMDHPFPNVELQTTGVLLSDKKNIFYDDGVGRLNETGGYNPDLISTIDLLKKLGVNTISLSISDPFSDENNMEIIGVPEKLRFDLYPLTQFIKNEGFNLRLSLNLTNVFDNIAPVNLFVALLKFKPDQITFRKLWHNGDLRLEQTEWVSLNACKPSTLDNIYEYISKRGKFLYELPFGGYVYSVMKISSVIDGDCMSKKNNNKVLKYVILRENGKLYCQWDDEGSLIF